MDDDTLALGTEVAAWAIKDFSVVLRQQITKAARQHDCTVAEWLHGHFQRFGVDGQGFAPVKLDPVTPAPDGAAIDELCKLADAAAKLAEFRERMPKALSGALSRRLRDALRTPEEQARPPRSRPRLIAAPEPPEAA